MSFEAPGPGEFIAKRGQIRGGSWRTVSQSCASMSEVDTLLQPVLFLNLLTCGEPYEFKGLRLGLGSVQ